jgi:tetraacyldisaccharide 4'-kinase
VSWGNPETAKEKFLSGLLWPAAAGYGVGLYTRLMGYNLKVLKQEKIGVPVISIGNITCGGTGKTPVTIDLARKLTDAGYKVGILSRGYRRQSKDAIVIVSDGQGNMRSCRESGDEPFMIAQAVPEAVVIVGSKRVDTAPIAVKTCGCDVILLDDGFQHFPLERDSDVVLIDYNDDLSKDSLLPAGRLREPLSALSRADWIVVTKVPAEPDLDRLLQMRAFIARYAPKAQVSSCRMASNALQMFGLSEGLRNISTLRGARVVAFSAIARPENFVDQLRTLGATVVAERSYGDHHWYTHKDVAEIRFLMQSKNADLIVTTEKDAVKLHPAMIKDMPIASLQQQLEWLGPLPLPKMLSATEKQPVSLGERK